jgi:hypothetical protein
MLGAIFDKVNKLFKKVDTNLDGQISQLPSQIWTYSNRGLTQDIASQVWTYSNRSLTQALQATYIEGMTPHVGIAVGVNISPQTTATLVSVTGSGILVGTTMRGDSYLRYKLIIDGTTYFINATYTTGSGETVTYIHMLPFNSSFIIQIYNSHSATTYSVLFIAASYLLH